MSEGNKSQSRFQPHLILYSNLFLLRPFPLIVLVKSGKQIMSHLQHPLDHLSQAALVHTVPIHNPCDQREPKIRAQSREVVPDLTC